MQSQIRSIFIKELSVKTNNKVYYVNRNDGVEGTIDDANMLWIWRVDWYISGDIPEVEAAKPSGSVSYLMGTSDLGNKIFIKRVPVGVDYSKIIKVYTHCAHIANVVSLRSFEKDDQFVYVAFEEAASSLAGYIGKRLSMKSKVFPISRPLLHKNGIILGAVAPQHVLIRWGPGNDDMIKLCGMSKSIRIHQSEKEKKVDRKVSRAIDELPSERKNKLTGIQSTGISSSDKWKNVERNETYAVVSDAQQTEVAPAEAASHDNWVACDQCNAPGKNYCDVSQDETTQAVHEMKFKISSQNHVIGDTYHTNSNANSNTMPNGSKKNKSRPEGSNSSQVETLHSSMDSRQKRKRLSEANMQLLEKNVVNKPIDVGRNDATVNGKGEPKPKRLKTKTCLDQHDHLTSTKIKNENERQAENTQASSKSKLLDRKNCEEVDMPAKKQKLKDQQDTQPYANTVKEKRLKTSNIDTNGEEKPLIKGNRRKIRLWVSRESSVDKSHEKNLNATSSRKDLKSKRFQFGATSSSSKVSGRRASLQEIKGSPIGSVSSSPLKAPNLVKLSPAAGRTISRKAHAKSSIGPEVPRKLLTREDNMQSRDIDASQSQKTWWQTWLKRKKASELTSTTGSQSSGKGSLLRSKDKDEKSTIQRVMLKAPAPLTKQESVPNKVRRVDVNGPASNDSSVGKNVIRKHLSDSIADQKPTTLTEHAQFEAKLGDMGRSEMSSTITKEPRKDSLGDISQRLDVEPFDGSGPVVSNVIKRPKDAANQNAKSLVKDCGTVVSFLKEYASSQTAMTAFKKAEESKDYADRLK
nr:cullin, conserved site-containing protein [Tanacetum cinerariifolium]